MAMTQISPDYTKPEVITVYSETVSCDGGAGPLGHPRVYMTINRHTGTADCPYCDRQFVLASDARSHAH